MQVDITRGAEENSYQDVFPVSTKCSYCDCKKEAELIFVAHEMNEKPEKSREKGEIAFLCEKHDNDPDGKGFWFHDAACFANYICRKCFKVTAIWNQA